MVRVRFEASLKQLHDNLIKMAVMTEIAIDEVIRALENQDIDLAHKIISADDQIDDMERKIERDCINLLATQAPVAKDVRLVASIMKMTTDIERIADHASDISEIVLEIAQEEYIWDISVIRRMSEFTRQMVKDAIRAHIDKDITLAKNVLTCDKEVNILFDKAVGELNGLMKEDGKNVGQGIKFLFISKYMERIGDHATNLAEWVMYNITGDLA